MTTQGMLTTEALTQLRGHAVIGSDGQKLGKVEEIYVDEVTGRPEWVSVKTGLFGTKHSFVPLQQMTMEDDALRVAYAKDLVAGSPRAETSEDGILTTDEEERLYAYYADHGYRATPYEAAPPSVDRATRVPTQDGRAPSGEGDDAMTRSEEEIRVGTARRESGRARLRKWVETEHVQETVPTRHENVRVEREPITEENIDRAMSGPELSEDEHEVVLYEEVPVVDRRVVPKERVRIMKEETIVDEQVNADVRKERIEERDDVRQRRTG